MHSLCHIQGLPVLTVRGDAFASLVASSLLESATEQKHNDRLSALIQESVKSFEETGTALSQNKQYLSLLKQELQRWNDYQIGFFDKNTHVKRLIQAWVATFDSKYLQSHHRVSTLKKESYNIVSLI